MVGLCQVWKAALRTLVVTFDTNVFPIETLFKRFNLCVHNATVKWRVLEAKTGKRFSR